MGEPDIRRDLDLLLRKLAIGGDPNAFGYFCHPGREDQVREMLSRYPGEVWLTPLDECPADQIITYPKPKPLMSITGAREGEPK